MRVRIRTVVSHLIVVFACSILSSCATVPQSPEDRNLERAIEQAIAAGPALSNAGIIVTVQNGVAILKGSVERGIDKTITEKLVRDIEGVTDVRNYIFVN